MTAAQPLHNPPRRRREPLPTRPWVESDRLDAHLDAVQAAPDVRAFCRSLAESGVAVIDLGEQARALCAQAVADTDPYFTDEAVARVEDAWLRSRAVRALATHPRIVDTLSLAYGRRAFAFQTLNFQRGTQQPIHSDAIHFHSEPAGFMCGVWIALEDIAPAAGPLQYVAGSHRLPVLTMQGAGVNHPQPTASDYDRTYIPALAGRLEASGLPMGTAVLRKGQALVWAANLAHGGAPVLDPACTRRSLVAHFYFEDCLYYTPMESDPEHGRFAVRLPLNVRTGGWVWPRRDGRRVKAPRSAIAQALKGRLLRRPAVQTVRNTPAPQSQPTS